MSTQTQLATGSVTPSSTQSYEDNANVAASQSAQNTHNATDASVDAGTTMHNVTTVQTTSPDAATTDVKQHNRLIPDLPNSAYLGIAKEYAEIHAKYSEAPKSFFYIDVLACIGVLFSDVVSFRKKQPRLYIIKIAEPSDRKSHSTDTALDFIENVRGKIAVKLKRLHDDVMHISRGAGSGEGLLEIFLECAECGKTLSHNKAHTDAADDSGDGNVKLHAFVPINRLILSYDEMRTFEQKSGPTSTLMTRVTGLFESNKFENKIKGGRQKSETAQLGFITNTTTQNWATMNKAGEMQGNGFLSRGFCLMGNWTEGNVQTLPPDVDFYSAVDSQRLRELEDELVDIYDSWDSTVVPALEMDDDARTLWDAYYRQNHRDIDWQRLDGYGVRFMILLTVTSGKRRIDVDVVQAVISLLKFEHELRQNAARPEDGKNPAKEFVRKFSRVLLKRHQRQASQTSTGKRQQSTGMTLRELRNATQGANKSEALPDVLEAVSKLETLGYVWRDAAGRLSLNPAKADDLAEAEEQAPNVKR